MANRNLVAVALGLGVALCAGSAMARERVDVQWAITIGSHGGAPAYGYSAPAYGYAAPVFVQPRAPVYMARHYQHPTRWDRDGDGIPNRYDRRYTPAWDRDGDGIPNRYDRHDRYERHDGRPQWRGR